MPTKICKQCGKEKDVSEFQHTTKNKDGCRPRCKECANWNHRSEESKKQFLEQQDFKHRKVKRCPGCGEIKSYDDFNIQESRRDGLSPYCSLCITAKSLEYSRRPYVQKKQDKYERSERYYANNKRRYEKKKVEDENYKLALYCRNRINTLIVTQNAKKLMGTFYLIGCSILELRQHIESQFEDGMTWQNHSRKGWHIDHRLPVNAFNLQDPIQQLAAFNWRNLHPMWGIPNIQKGAKYNQDEFDAYMNMFKELQTHIK